MHKYSVLLLLTLSPIAAASPQGELFTFPGATAVNAGDLDGDGKVDYLVGAPDDTGASAGHVAVYSGATGAQLALYQPILPVTRVGDRVAALGDVDGDGTLDFAALENETARQFIAVVSGATGALLYRIVPPTPQHSFGDFVALGDVDGDGRPDLADGEFPPYGPPYLPGVVCVRSGASGALLRTIAAPAGETAFGNALGLHEDLDHDGVRDLLVGGRTGAVYIVSPASGATLFTSVSTAPGYGASVASLGDVDGDGTSDIAVGAPSSFSASTFDSSIHIVAVPSGATIQTINAAWGQILLGTYVARIGDYDGDGLADVLFSAGEHRIGCCTVTLLPNEIRSGLTGALLYSSWVDRFTSLDGLGDVDGNGTPDYLAGGHDTGLGQLRCAVVLTNRLATCLAAHCDYPENHDSIGCTPALGAWGAPSLTTGDAFNLSVSGVHNNRRGVIVWSTNWMPGTFAGQSFCVGAPRHVLGAVWSGGSTSGANCSGHLALPLPKPTMAALGWTAGQALVAQAVFRDPNTLSAAQVSLTDAIGIYVWP